MNRRGHLSAKVPNVKLRPRTRRHASPLPLDNDSEIVQRAWEDAGADDDIGPSTSGTDKPWRGITITFTGVDDKPALAKLVKDLGGEIETALTVNVTHVVAPGFGSPKYLYAIEHSIPVVSPSWIRDAHAKWLAGEELDVPASIEAHRLQAFIGLKIAISGIESLDRRKLIIRYIQDNGGVYSKDLDRSCTHLVSAWPTSDPKAKQSEKVKWILKQLGDRDAARRRGKPFDSEDPRIVYEEWLWDCIAYRGRWKEENYDARKPRGKGRVTFEEVHDGSVYERLRPKPLPVPEEDEGPVVVRKRKRDNMENLVGELLSTANVPEPEPAVAEPMNVDAAEGKAPPTPPPEDELPSRGDVFDRKPSILHASRSTSFANNAAAGPSSGPAPPRSGPFKQIYAGLRFSHTIPAGHEEALENALRMHGATVVPEAERLAGAPVDYVVKRIEQPSPEVPPMESEPKPEVVTECWIEACCFEQSFLPPDSNLVFRPLPFPIPLAGAEEFVVHVTGFPSDVSVFLRRMLRAIGMTVEKTMSKHRTTHIVMGTPKANKREKAIEWGVKVVRESWVWAMGKEGRIAPVEEHALDLDQAPPATTSTVPLNTSAAVLNTSDASGDVSLDAADAAPRPTSRADLSGTTVGSGRAAPLSPAERLNRTDSPASRGGTPGQPSPKPLTTESTDDDVTAALRLLVAKGDAAPRSAAPTRRSRPASRVLGPSASNSGPLPPSALASASTSPANRLGGLEHMPPGFPNGVEDESMRVTYADPRSEKERRRLMDAVMRGEAKRTRL